MSTLRNLARRILSVTSADARGVADQQTRHVVDAIGGGHAAASLPEVGRLVPLFENSPAWEAPVLSAAIRASEVDDIELHSCTTPTSVAAAAALAMAARDPSLQPDVRAAVLAGTDAIVRLGRAMGGPAILYSEHWPTALAAPAGAAAVAARLMRLDGPQTVTALCTALITTAGAGARFTGKLPARWLVHASAVQAGIRAAFAAQAGFEADPDLLDRDWLAQTHNIVPDLACLDESEPGKVYGTISLKPFCSARQALGAVDTLLDFLSTGPDPAAVDRIVVTVPVPVARMLDRPVDLANRASTYVSLPYQLAVAAYRPERLQSVSRHDMPMDAGIAALMERVTIVGSPGLERGEAGFWTASLEVVANGMSTTLDASHARGSPRRPLSDAEVRRKFEANVAPQEIAAAFYDEAGRCLDVAQAARTVVDTIISRARSGAAAPNP